MKPSTLILAGLIFLSNSDVQRLRQDNDAVLQDTATAIFLFAAALAVAIYNHRKSIAKFLREF